MNKKDYELIAKILRGIDDQPKRIWLAIRFAQELKKNKGALEREEVMQ